VDNGTTIRFKHHKALLYSNINKTDLAKRRNLFPHRLAYGNALKQKKDFSVWA
jgi:hypothetical protein